MRAGLSKIHPLVGVVVACYNQGRFLQNCVRSIESQDWPEWTALIVDDASDDGVTPGLVDRASGKKISVAHLQKNRGISYVRNFGLSYFETSDFVLFVDADDWLSADYVGLLLDELSQDPELAGVYGTQVWMGADGASALGRLWPTQDPYLGNPYASSLAPGGGVLFRVTALRETHGWRDEFSSLFEDWEIALQLLNVGRRLRWVRDAAYFYRVHQDSALARWSAADSFRFRTLLLRFHKQGITSRMGLRAYAELYLLPAIVSDFRRGRLQQGFAKVASVAGSAPVETIAALLRYYGSRTREVLRSDGAS